MNAPDPGFLAARWAAEPKSAEAVVWRGRTWTYRELATARARWATRLAALEPDGAVGLRADFAPDALAALVALAELRRVVVPLPEPPDPGEEARLVLAGARYLVSGTEVTDRGPARARPPLYRELDRRGHAGLVVFTSGSTSAPKGIVHDLDWQLAKFGTRRAPLRTIAFLLFDHLGGLNTALHTLSSGGALIVPASRRPDDVCAAVARHRAELVPATPTFLNLLLASGAHRRHDLGSLRVISYGAEPMPARTLARIREAFPGVELRQTYGLAEVGVLRVRPRADGSLWMRIGGERLETRVVEGTLHLRGPALMLGYLDGGTPMREDGWLDTGDAVEVDGDEIRVLGRRTDLVKVAGHLVSPVEVEAVIEEVRGVAAAAVTAEPNPLVGSLLVARIQLGPEVSASDVASRVRRHCADRLPRVQVPARIVVVDEDLHGERFKKRRRPA
ncbi:MAG TPA: long-chain fatty acid--CoA ligase [Candidatus Dormibacteraeota bacterium]|nr:long-chain fatty acid--CoA ligase [Candidatus Dormibacteraeota bacterium]